MKKLILYFFLFCSITTYGQNEIFKKYAGIKNHISKGDTASYIKDFILFYHQDCIKYIKQKNSFDDVDILIKDIEPYLLNYHNSQTDYIKQFGLLCLIKHNSKKRNAKQVELYISKVKEFIERQEKQTLTNYHKSLLNVIRSCYLQQCSVLAFDKFDYGSSIKFAKYSNKIINDIFQINATYSKSNSKSYLLKQTNYDPMLDIHKSIFGSSQKQVNIQLLLNGLYGINILNIFSITGSLNMMKQHQEAIPYINSLHGESASFGIDFFLYYLYMKNLSLSENYRLLDYRKDIISIEKSLRNTSLKYDKIRLYMQLCSFYEVMKMYDKLFVITQKGLQLQDKTIDYYTKQLISYQVSSLMHFKKYNDALKICNEGINICLSGNTNKFPSDDIVCFTDLMLQKANILWLLDDKNTFINTVMYIDKYLSYIFSLSKSDESKLNIINKHMLKLYEQSVDACWQLNNKDYLFYFIEKSRYILLQESIKKSEVTNFLSIKQIQAKLTKQQTYISFFISENDIYVYSISNKESYVQKIHFSQQSQAILNEFLSLSSQNALKNGKIDSVSIDYIRKRFPTVSYQLYKILFEPLHIKPNSEVIVSTNGTLLPFAALMKSDKGFDTKNYLIQDYTFSYAYSANFLFNAPTTSKKPIENQLLAIYPNHYQSRSQSSTVLSPLEETGSITAIKKNGYYGRVLSNEQANKATFLEALPTSQIAYFFTHAQAKGNTEPVIYFQKDSLMLSEIYKLQGKLSTELVCFAACETGIGEEKKGEGVMSIARGFAYAGVPASVSTLWSVFSNYTDTLYQLFFYNMSQKKPKNIALRDAQLTFLAEADAHAQLPVSWAGLVLIGNNTAILPQSPSYQLIGWTIGGLLICLLVLFFLYRRR
jgi:CHAT domain-containing protein